MPRIRDIAAVCKSKNAGPFELTIDVVFDDPALFDKVKRTGVLGPELFARLYGVRAQDVLFTVYGAQQHAPLLDVDIPGLSGLLPCFDRPNRAKNQLHTRNRLT